MYDVFVMDIEGEIKEIKERNSRVEADKGWERSPLRVGFIAAITYVTACVFLVVIKAENAPLAALVPVLGFIFSVQTFPPIKKFWREKFWKGKSLS